MMSIAMKKKERIEFIERTLDRYFPNTPIPLKHEDHYTLLIAVLLSAQCTDARVNLVTPNLFKKAKTPEKMIQLTIQEIEKIRNKNNVKIYPNLPRAQFKGLMNVAKIMIGNSSAGLTETAQFNLPVINIGTRQAGRERGNNIYDSKCDAVQISKLIKKLINKKTKKIIESPYSCNKTPYQIKEVLKNIELNKNLIQKKMSY